MNALDVIQLTKTFFMTFSMINNPNNPITNIASFVPLASIIIMPAKMVKPGGRLYLFDVVFPSDMPRYEARFDEWIRTMAGRAGVEFAAEAEAHIRDEYSTYDWIMEGFLNRAGFRIDRAEYMGGFGGSFLCTKAKD